MPPNADPRRPLIWNAVAPVVAGLAQRLDRRFRWDRLPPPLGIFALLGLRHSLRQRNLYDPDLLGRADPRDADDVTPEAFAARPLTRRLDGRNTHPTRATMGAAGTRFARNLPVVPQVDLASSEPDAAAVSEALLRRTEFVAATSLNMLAAAWLQFEVHDWFAHEVQPDAEPLPPGLNPLKPDATATDSMPVYVSDQSHWWDASQLYGAGECFAAAIRSEDSDMSGKVKVDGELLEVIEKFQTGSGADLCPEKSDRMPNPVPNLWLGLALFHIAFAREHNAICDRLREVYPRWTGQRVYDQARMINAAVMAKIHTVEWTPALLAHPVTIRAIQSTWWGLLGERFRKRFGRIGAGEILSGIPGSWMDDDVPYALTEEFAAVYRMHPLLPAQITFRRASDDAPVDLESGATIDFEDLVVTPEHPGRARQLLEDVGVVNAWYSLAISHPGALTLHNYPSFRARLPSGVDVDLGAADILRTRECGVPRYNDFRRSLRMPAAESFLELADGHVRFANEIRDVYHGKLEDVDLIVGLLADRKPAGFAISDTAFRIFLLMAARRLRSDRFFTTDYTPEAYTPLGLDWIENANMADILRRHYPPLAPALGGVENVFMPWPRMPART